MAISLQQQSIPAIMHGSMRQSSERAERIIQKVRYHQQQPLSTGYMEIARQMRAYASLTPQETDIAVRAYKNGQSVGDLAQVAPFQEKLAVEEARRFMQGRKEDRASYQLLFTERNNDGTPITIPGLIAIAHHDLILQWISAYESMFRDLALPLADFYNKALSNLLPHEVETYNPDIVPESFTSWASRMLFWRLHDEAQKRARELRSLPVNMKPTTKTAFKDSARQSILSLDMALEVSQVDEMQQTYADALVSPQREREQLESTAVIKHLFTLAGLTAVEQDALVRVVINKDTSKEAGVSMRRSDRTVRNARDRAIAKLMQVGDEQTIAAILRGDREEGTQGEQIEGH